MQPLVPLRKAVCNFTFPSTETVWHCALLRCLLSRVWTRESKNLVYFSEIKKAKGLRLKTQSPYDRLFTGVTNEKAADEDIKQQGGLEMNPITTYCSRGDSHPAAATPAAFVWWITSGKCQKKKRKTRDANWPTSNQSKTAAFILP